jgi:hypothetical protein
MTKAGHRRALGMRATGVLCAILAVGLSLAAQDASAASGRQQTALFTIRNPIGLATSTVERLDPTTGATTPLADFTPLGQTVGALVADPTMPRLYGIASVVECGRGIGCIVVEQRIATIGSVDGAINESPPLSTIVDGPLAYDPSSGSLWAVSDYFTAVNGGQPQQIVRINPQTGDEATVATVSTDQTSLPAAIAVDAHKHVLYLAWAPSASTPYLMRLDTRTGVVVHGPSLKVALNQLILDPLTRKLEGITAGSPQQLVRINPQTGAEATVFAFDLNTTVEWAAVDAQSRTLYTMAAGIYVFPASMAIVDLKTHTSRSGPALPGEIYELVAQSLGHA